MAEFDAILFGKYQLCRMIGKGRTGTVFQARHLGLGEYRAIKRVAKADVGYEEFRREALVLKELRHPGIPIVYDLEEDETYCYLVEEFLEGESLNALVKRQGGLTGNMVIQYGIQICDLVHYLHSVGNEPILYLDLQPNNLLLCHGSVKLVDFGSAAFLPQANEAGERRGTPGCAAPEQYTGEPMDERTDIYAIGVLLLFMAFGKLPEEKEGALNDWDLVLGRGLARLARDCMNRRAARPASALEVKRRLEELVDVEPPAPQKDSLPSLILSIAGSAPNVGATHLAMGLSACLWKWGIPNLYQERNPSGCAMAMAQWRGAGPDSAGVCEVGPLAVRPEYGPQVRLKENCGFPVVLRDYGEDFYRAAAETRREEACAARALCVLGGKPWDEGENRRAVSAFSEAGLFVIYNFTVRGYQPARPRNLGPERCMAMPWFPEPLRPTREAERFFRELWDRLTEKKGDDRPGIFLRRDKMFWKKKKP